MNSKNIIEDLEFRGLVHQSTDLKQLKKELDKPMVLYVGFDPTADSVHIGNLLQILTLRRFQNAGHKPIILIGGVTGLIGDPSGKGSERQLNSEEKVKEWSEKIKKQLEKFLDFDGSVKIINNYEWLGDMKVIPFLRDIGKSFSINSMIAKESVKRRLETGISFTEFSYQILQSYDYLNLFKKYNCKLQIGGSDQWGNITAGVDLIRRSENVQVFGLTLPLVVKSDGTKFGKTAGQSIWLDPKKTTPYEFYQFWINVGDNKVIQLLKFFTFISHSEINELEKELKGSPSKGKGQKKLAEEVTKLVHGEKLTKRAQKISEALFYGDIEKLAQDELEEGFSNVPSYEVSGEKLELVNLLKEAGVVSSKRQAREDIKNKAIYLNEKQIDTEKVINLDERLHQKYLIIKRGKKNYYFIKWNN